MSEVVFKSSSDLSKEEKAIVIQEIKAGFEALQGSVTVWSDDKILKELENHNSIASFLKNELVAIILYRKIPSDVIEISWLNTTMKYLRSGHMSVLLERLMSLYSGYEIWLEVSESNQAAISFYSSMGFVCTGSRGNYYPNGDTAMLYSYVEK